MGQKKVLFLSIIFSTTLLMAWSKQNIAITSQAMVEKKEVTQEGEAKVKLIPASKVTPGEEVVFVISYKNIGSEAATDLVVTNPIPNHMTYRNTESDAKAESEVSVDGGKEWGELTNLKVLEKRKLRPALPTDVTHVRWKLNGAVQPNQEGIVRLIAVLN